MSSSTATAEVLAKLVLSVARLAGDAPLGDHPQASAELLAAAAKLGIHTDSDPLSRSHDSLRCRSFRMCDSQIWGCSMCERWSFSTK